MKLKDKLACILLTGKPTPTLPQVACRIGETVGLLLAALWFTTVYPSVSHFQLFSSIFNWFPLVSIGFHWVALVSATTGKDFSIAKCRISSPRQQRARSSTAFERQWNSGSCESWEADMLDHSAGECNILFKKKVEIGTWNHQSI